MVFPVRAGIELVIIVASVDDCDYESLQAERSDHRATVVARHKRQKIARFQLFGAGYADKAAPSAGFSRGGSLRV